MSAPYDGASSSFTFSQTDPRRMSRANSFNYQVSIYTPIPTVNLELSHFWVPQRTHPRHRSPAPRRRINSAVYDSYSPLPPIPVQRSYSNSYRPLPPQDRSGRYLSPSLSPDRYERAPALGHDVLDSNPWQLPSKPTVWQRPVPISPKAVLPREDTRRHSRDSMMATRMFEPSDSWKQTHDGNRSNRVER